MVTDFRSYIGMATGWIDRVFQYQDPDPNFKKKHE